MTQPWNLQGISTEAQIFPGPIKNTHSPLQLVLLPPRTFLEACMEPQWKTSSHPPITDWLGTTCDRSKGNSREWTNLQRRFLAVVLIPFKICTTKTEGIELASASCSMDSLMEINTGSSNSKQRIWKAYQSLFLVNKQLLSMYTPSVLHILLLLLIVCFH